MVANRKKKIGPGRPRSAESERAILDATAKLLVDEGYSGLTLSKVAARARASKSTIYRRWPTKEHLIVASFNRWPALTPHDSGDVLKDLLDLHVQSTRNLRKGGMRGVMPKLIAERAENPLLAEVLDPLLERRYDPIRLILHRAVERRQLPKDTDIELAVHAISGIIAARLYFLPGDRGLPAIRKVLNLLLKGLGARGC